MKKSVRNLFIGSVLLVVGSYVFSTMKKSSNKSNKVKKEEEPIQEREYTLLKRY